jgi:hypothetical protein
MSTSVFSQKMKGLTAGALGVAAAFALASGTAVAQPDLNTIAPTSGPFTGGTPVQLTGNFSIGENTPSLTTYRVFFSADNDLDTGSDLEALVTGDNNGTSISAVTPGVAAPGTFNVFVVVSNQGVNGSQESDSVAFNYTAVNETPTQTAARTLNDNFAAADTDDNNLISRQEAAAFGVSNAEFDAIDTNDDEFLSPAELEAAARPQGICERFQALLPNFTLVGLIALILSIFDDFRRTLFGSPYPFPGNPEPGRGNDDEPADEIGNG